MRKLLATTSPKMVVFVASDNLSRAMSFGYKLISGTDPLQEFPDLGRGVSEYGHDLRR